MACIHFLDVQELNIGTIRSHISYWCGWNLFYVARAFKGHKIRASCYGFATYYFMAVHHHHLSLLCDCLLSSYLLRELDSSMNTAWTDPVINFNIWLIHFSQHTSQTNLCTYLTKLEWQWIAWARNFCILDRGVQIPALVLVTVYMPVVL